MMKKCAEGCIVRSLGGRDRKRVFLVTGICDEESGMVYIADGKLHPISRPKKKNLLHLAVLAAAEDAETSFLWGTDEELYESLQGFEGAQRRNKEA